MSAAVEFLESLKFEHMQQRRGQVRRPMVALKGDGNTDLVFDHLPHLDDFCETLPDLCSGEGYRWAPGDPVARFA